jgi:hypothetical protein
LRGRVAHRALTSQFSDATLDARYGGTLTEDGLAVQALSTSMKQPPLDATVALSDTYVSEDGVTVSDVRFARGVTRLDDGDVDSAATLHVAHIRHTKRG